MDVAKFQSSWKLLAINRRIADRILSTSRFTNHILPGREQAAVYCGLLTDRGRHRLALNTYCLNPLITFPLGKFNPPSHSLSWKDDWQFQTRPIDERTSIKMVHLAEILRFVVVFFRLGWEARANGWFPRVNGVAARHLRSWHRYLIMHTCSRTSVNTM